MMEDELNCASKSMEMCDMKRYYIIELERPVGNKKFLCLPNYWIDRVVDDNTVVVSLPGDLLALGDSSAEDWKTEKVDVRRATDSYKVAQNYLNYLNRNFSSRQAQIKETHSKGNEPLACGDTASSSPNKKYIRSNTDLKTVAEIVINVLEYFLGNTRDEPQKISNDASANSVKSKIKKRMELSVSEIITKMQSLDKQCSQTEDNLHDDESESDDDFEKSAISKIVRTDKSSDYQYTQEMTNKPLKMKIKRTPVASTKTAVDSGISNVDKQPQSTSTTDSIQSEFPLDKSVKNSHNPIQCTKNDQHTSIIIEHNIPPRFYEDYDKKLSRIEELTKQVENHQNLLSRAYSDIEKNKYEIGELKNSLRNFTNPQKVVMNVEENNKNGGEIERLNDSRSEKFKQSEVKQINKRRKSTVRGEDENNIAGNTSSEQVILPMEQERRWTLKYRDKKQGLVELMHNSGIYVKATNLFRILSESKDSKDLARRLLVAIFNDRALITCNLFGNRRGRVDPKNLLDKNAMNILLSVVLKHAYAKEWASLNTRREILQHQRCVKISLRNYLANWRKKYYRTQQLIHKTQSNVMYSRCEKNRNYTPKI